MQLNQSKLAAWVRQKVVPVIDSPQWGARIGVAFGAATASIVMTLSGLIVFYVGITFILALPVVIGVSDGRTRSDEATAEFAANCTRIAGKAFVSLIKNGVEVARGYVIDSSHSFIALYDVNRSGPRVLPREGIEVSRVLASSRP